jgi:hypothetical protein
VRTCLDPLCRIFHDVEDVCPSARMYARLLTSNFKKLSPPLDHRRPPFEPKIRGSHTVESHCNSAESRGEHGLLPPTQEAAQARPFLDMYQLRVIPRATPAAGRRNPGNLQPFPSLPTPEQRKLRRDLAQYESSWHPDVLDLFCGFCLGRNYGSPRTTPIFPRPRGAHLLWHIPDRSHQRFSQLCFYPCPLLAIPLSCSAWNSYISP